MPKQNKLTKLGVKYEQTQRGGIFAISDLTSNTVYIDHSTNFLRRYYKLLETQNNELQELLNNPHTFTILEFKEDMKEQVGHLITNLILQYEGQNFKVIQTNKKIKEVKLATDFNEFETKEQIEEMIKYCQKCKITPKDFIQTAIRYFGVNKIFVPPIIEDKEVDQC